MNLLAELPDAMRAEEIKKWESKYALSDDQSLVLKAYVSRVAARAGEHVISSLL